MINHLSHLTIWNAVFNLDRIPVFFVHVITWRDLLVSVAELEREVRIAF
ncbi:MAG TPA: hypothetical protein VFA51_01045 [Candidatus Udaeobacter sp.]|nr:hypothetical protein [Candidatus Udaeobacter sp.]